MKRHMLKSATLAGVALALCIVVGVNAGDLNPPPGEVRATDRVRINEQYIEITGLPYTISEPGSYVLTSNVTGVEGEHGIVIDADNVTLDLHGFSLIGVPGSHEGIVVSPGGHHNIAVKNGHVIGWGEDGVHLGADNVVVAGIHSRSNGSWGIWVSDCAVITGCVVRFNGGIGIEVSHNAVIDSCVVMGNGSRGAGCGIRAGSGATLRSCTVALNTGDGIYLYNGTGHDDGNVSVTGCTSRDNGGIGINLATGGLAAGCVANGNDGDGINAVRCTITNCTASSNGDHGIEADNSLIRGNTAVGNTTGNICPGSSTMIDNHAPEVP